MNCERDSCQDSTVMCPPDGHCVVNCRYDYACRNSEYSCSSGGQCEFTFFASVIQQYYGYTGQNMMIMCEENSSCTILVHWIQLPGAITHATPHTSPATVGTVLYSAISNDHASIQPLHVDPTVTV